MTSEQEMSSSVLIVDTEPEVLLLLSSILEHNGIRTLLARTAPEALEITRRGYVPIDLILCNAGVGETTAPDLLTALRKIRPGLRAVWMSAFVDDGVVRIGLARKSNGAAGPLGEEGLIAAVQAALRGPDRGVGAAN